MYNPFSLEGKTILVTGASSGIGKSTAIECSKMGATVIITGRNEERLTETFDNLDNNSCGHKQIIADLTSESGLNTLLTQLPKLDGAVLCAGVSSTTPFQFAKREKLDHIFNLNFFSQAETIRLLYKNKILKNASSIVLIASIGGVYTFNVGNSIYGASKAALHSTMKFCAKEFAQRMIRVNCVCPGMVETPLIYRGTISEEQLQEDMKRYPLKRYGKPEEVAYAAIYLLSDATSWITGQDIVIAGGLAL